jgi:hypothetical protein
MKFQHTVTGQIYSLNKDVIVQILCEAGILKEIPPLPSSTTQPTGKWVVFRHDSGRISIKFDCPKCNQGCRVEEENGELPNTFTPITYFASKFWHCGKADTIPESVIAEYKLLRG